MDCTIYSVLQFPMSVLMPKSQGKASKICHGFLLSGALIALLDPVLEGTGEEGG